MFLFLQHSHCKSHSPNVTRARARARARACTHTHAHTHSGFSISPEIPEQLSLSHTCGLPSGEPESQTFGCTCYWYGLEPGSLQVQCKALMWFNSFILMGLSFPRMTASPSIELYWTVRLLWSSQPLDLSTDLASVGSSFWVTIVESLGTRKFCPRAPLNVNPALSLCEEASNLWF